MSAAGHVIWPLDRPVWDFHWRLGGSPDGEGIALTKVRFKDHGVLFKASLPMIRVQYDYLDFSLAGLQRHITAGPYKDQLSADNAILFEGSFGNFRVGVQVREGVTHEGLRYLVVDSGHTIGQYRLTGRWIFREDGIILPQLYSAGLQFPANHRHHAYWRFDFDIDGPDDNMAFNRLDWWPQDWGWGPGWRPIEYESSYSRPASSKIAVLNTRNGRGYLVLPGPNDGEADGFSEYDFWVHRYHTAEDFRGSLGSPTDDQLVTLHTNESTDGHDIVAWYCAHLNHEAAHGGDEWHVCGPILVPFGF